MSNFSFEKMESKSHEIRDRMKSYSIFDYIFFFCSASVVAGVIVTLQNGNFDTLSILGWIMCVIWMMITRGYRGIVKAYKDNNDNLLDLVVELLKEKLEKEKGKKNVD